MRHAQEKLDGGKAPRTRTGTAIAACLFFAVPALLGQSTKPADPKCKPDSKSAACATKNTSDNGSPSPSTPSTPDSGSAPGKSMHEEFPFPTEDSKHGGDADTNGLPSMPTGGVPDPPASSERPVSPPSSSGGSSSSSSSSSSDDGSSSSKSNDDDADVAPTTAAPNAPVKAKALKDLGSRGDTTAARAKLEKTRVADDLKVARFYRNDGNNQGAYMRYKDAVDHDPEDPDARFGLAEMAEKLNKRDEAVLNYREYLNLDAGGDHDRETRRALEKLGVVAK